ncbi:MAG: hypothetical protein AMXMBFR34_46630 [Myxococcaceae bacterium]
MVGERCGITIPSRYVFEHSGFDAMLQRVGVKRSLFDEEVQVEIPLTHKGRLRDAIFVPEPVAKADFFVNVPKFKSHPWTTVTFSMKNYIGIQDDRHRLIDHDHRLNEKVADLQYVVQPKLIVIDGIVAGEGRMLTPIPRKLQLIVVGNNQPAIDAVCCRIIGVDPATVEHIELASRRGFGPIDLSQIELKGDLSLAQEQERAKGFSVGLVRVEKYFEGTKISAYAGPPPSRSAPTTAGAAARGRSRRRSRSCGSSTSTWTRSWRGRAGCTWCSARTRAKSPPSPAIRSSSSATARSGRGGSSASTSRWTAPTSPGRRRTRTTRSTTTSTRRWRPSRRAWR